MKKNLSISFIFLFFFLNTMAQKDIIVTIGDKKFTKDEYEKIYIKNNTQLNDESEVKTPEEYLDLFVNYKLKVIEAEKVGLDTIKAFKDELAGYRDELAKPYLTDITINDSILQETYYRTNHLIKASHILLNLPANASAEDTLKVYNQMLDIRQQFIDRKKSFEELAVEFSNDPSASFNKGDLGYFKAFSMITEFENAAYSTKIGEVSMPIHTEFGYHIIYVTDLIESTGEIKVSHIMKMFKNRSNVSEEEDVNYKHQMDSIYQLLQKGADFATIAQEFSDDKNSAKNGGDMGFIARSFNVPEFAEAVFSLQTDSAYTQPIRTMFGWHVIKRTGYKPVPTFDEAKVDLTEKVRRDPLRSKHSKELYYQKKKQELNLVEYPENMAKFKGYINDLYPDTIFNEIFPEEILALPLYKIDKSTYTVRNFFDLQKQLKQNKSKFLKPLFFFHLDNYDETVITDYMKNHLEQLYPEFAQIMQEYHDGMLLFSIMEQKVWNKAVLDSIGLSSFYNKHKDKYLWNDHFKGIRIRCNNEEIADSCKRFIAEGITDADSLEKRMNIDGKTNIRIDKGNWEEGSNKRIDFLVFNGEKPENLNPELEFVNGELIKAGDPKTLDEARGLYISDYQQELETQWINELRNSTKIKVNTKLLKQVKSIK